MKRIKVKKVFKGCISLRDYAVEEAIEQSKGIMVEFQEGEMFLGVDELKKGKRNNLKLQSSWGDKTYDLIDYPWQPNPRLF